ncbi:hypothetical protein JMJ58_03655 [Haloterrigena salifodinae]|uniref:Uncharacterized protein n=1 Tax=Haloterrigena salifodinae TaxID=2675099 RepID=A0A8T8E2C0_9EURY|nr:hypothetical protein [Haloterrigena salifodinae]QRV16004.1 hypothetical protein JMJ58_03655 [Haloterrigena salifodinae]
MSIYTSVKWKNDSALYRAVELLELAYEGEELDMGVYDYGDEVIEVGVPDYPHKRIQANKSLEKIRYSATRHQCDEQVSKASRNAYDIVIQITERIDDDDLRNQLLSNINHPSRDLPDEYEQFYQQLASAVEESIERDDTELSDLEGFWVRERDENAIYEFPAGIIYDMLDNPPEGVICVGSRWTMAEMDYWASPAALVAVADGIVEPEQIQGYESSDILSPAVTDYQKFWVNSLTNSQLIDVFSRVRELGAIGEVPYSVLLAIGEIHDLELTEDGKLTRQSRSRAEELFEAL